MDSGATPVPPTAAASTPGSGPRPGAGRTAHEITIEREIKALKTMILEEAATAIGMIERAAEALVKLDEIAARLVISQDDEIDAEEVKIEEACFRVLALFHPFAKDFRHITSMVKVNSDLERVADHATSIAKQTVKLKKLGVTQLPTSLGELAERVPILCHAVLNAMASENVETAHQLLDKDKQIDDLEKHLFDECIATIGGDRESKAAALLMYRCGREMERVGDLMKNIAEDLIYQGSGTIVRHEKR